MKRYCCTCPDDISLKQYILNLQGNKLWYAVRCCIQYLLFLGQQLAISYEGYKTILYVLAPHTAEPITPPHPQQASYMDASDCDAQPARSLPPTSPRAARRGRSPTP